ncbi:osmotin-like protein OSM34 [Apium graveolens]|uniref:osmotin-like protein OSM34 n=1 Tax=Apium graveolens TaxID=4045 RepID=UPI003D794461
MSYLATFSLIILSTLLITTNAVNFQARNNFPYVVWADASPGGGPQLNPNDESSLDVAPGTKFARTWGRTNCKFGASGCETEDWNMQLECTGNNGKARNRVAEYAFVTAQIFALVLLREIISIIARILGTQLL